MQGLEGGAALQQWMSQHGQVKEREGERRHGQVKERERRQHAQQGGKFLCSEGEEAGKKMKPHFFHIPC